MASTWMALERRAITDQELLDAKMNILPAPPIAVPNSFNVAATQPRHPRRSGTHAAADEVPEQVEEDQSSSVYSNPGDGRERSGPVGDSGIASAQDSLKDLQDTAGIYLSTTELQDIDVEGNVVE